MTSPISDTEKEGSGAVLAGKSPRPISRRGGRLRAIILPLGFVVVVFLAGFVRFVLVLEQEERQPERHADGIVALTGGADRVADAVALLSQGHADRLLITGMNATTTREDLARRIPVARKWVECCVDLGYKAADTVGNARETADWVRAGGLRSLIVVTSNYHMPRAIAEMSAELPDVDLQAYAVVPERNRPMSIGRSARLARLLLVEYVKLLAVQFRQTVETWSVPSDGLHLAAGRKP